MNFPSTTKRLCTTHATQPLQQAEGAAESASRAKRDFLAKMSHELRTPLNGVIGAVQLLSNTALGPEQREYLQIARTSAEGLLQVINDILDFSRAESGKLHFEHIDFNLRHKLEDALTTLSVRTAEKGLELACQVAPEVPEMLVGDPGRLRQVVLNLVGNAIKFTERGQVRVAVEVQERTSHGTSLHFAITDTGMGISPDSQPHIFAPFEQGDGSITRKYGGTGLGLAISAQLVDIMGGVIWVDSEVGKGSTFHFTARFGVSACPNTTICHDVLAASPENAQEHTSLRILIAEDNIINQKIAVRALEKWGYTVDVANHGREALAKLDQQPFDVILMDLQMPELDGFETTRAIRQREKATGTRVPIIAVTAHAMQGDSECCFQAGMDSYVSKPLQLQELFGEIQAVLARSKGKTSSSARQDEGDQLVPRVKKPEAVNFPVGELAGFSTEIMDAFISDTPEQLKKLRLAAQNQDAATMKRLAHYLKGSAMYVGAEKMTQLCKQVELLAEQDGSRAAEAVTVLGTEAARVCATLEFRMQGSNCE